MGLGMARRIWSAELAIGQSGFVGKVKMWSVHLITWTVESGDRGPTTSFGSYRRIILEVSKKDDHFSLCVSH